MTNQGILPRHSLGCNDTLAPGHETPSTRSKGFVQDASVFDFGEVDNPVRFDFDIFVIHFFE